MLTHTHCCTHTHTHTHAHTHTHTATPARAPARPSARTHMAGKIYFFVPHNTGWQKAHCSCKQHFSSMMWLWSWVFPRVNQMDRFARVFSDTIRCAGRPQKPAPCKPPRLPTTTMGGGWPSPKSLWELCFFLIVCLGFSRLFLVWYLIVIWGFSKQYLKMPL